MMRFMRLFIAILIPSEVVGEVTNVLKKAPPLPALRWVRPEFMHITLKFLGEVNPARLEEINAPIEKVVRKFTSFNINLKNAGAFPRLNAPLACWIGVGGQIDILDSLAQAVHRALNEECDTFNGNKFKGHVTVARTRSKGKPTKDGKGFCKLFESFQTTMFQINSIHLIESVLGSTGAHYKVLHSFPLGLAN